jgi:hypothetical protein
MGRMVRAAAPPVQPRRATKALARGDGEGEGDETQRERGDGYLDRVAKYVPAEVIAFFIFVNSIVGDSIDKGMASAMEAQQAPAGSDRYQALLTGVLKTEKMGGIEVWTISWVVLIVALAMTPLYLLAMRDPQDGQERPWMTIAVAMVAFPIWAYAVDAVAFRPWHDGALASIALATFTIVSGAIKPGLFNGLKWKKPQE